MVSASGQLDGLTVVDPPLRLDRVPFIMFWHRRNDGHPAQRWLRETIASLFLSEP